MPCSGALFCWKIKKSPDTSRITGNSCCDWSMSPVIATVDLHLWMDKDEVRGAKLWNADKHRNRSTKRLSHVQLVTNLSFEFPQVVWQHTLGVVEDIMWVLFTIYSSFQRWKNLENRLDYDKVITIIWVVHFFGTLCTRYFFSAVAFILESGSVLDISGESTSFNTTVSLLLPGAFCQMPAQWQGSGIRCGHIIFMPLLYVKLTPTTQQPGSYCCVVFASSCCHWHDLAAVVWLMCQYVYRMYCM